MAKEPEARNLLGDKIYRLRKQKGVSQEELGNIIGVSRQSISKWELNEMTPNFENISQLSKYFEVSVDSFMYETSELCGEMAATKDAPKGVKMWISLSVIGGIITVGMIVFTICMSIIILTTNIGDQIIQTQETDIWGLAIYIFLTCILLIAEIVLIVITVKKAHCKC